MAMVRTLPRWVLLLTSTALFGACGSNPAVTNPGNTLDAGTGDDQDAGAGSKGDDGGGLMVGNGNAGSSSGEVTEKLTVKAERSTVTVELGSALPEVAMTAFLGDVPAKVAWRVDRGDLASISPGIGSETAFVPTGNTAGEVTVTAVVGKQQAHVVITVQIRGSQNGADKSVPGQALQIPSSVGKLTEGGGPGGVGGQGLGVAIKDKGVLDALDKPASDGSD